MKGLIGFIITGIGGAAALLGVLFATDGLARITDEIKGGVDDEQF